MPNKEAELLTQKIKDWNTNLEFFKKLVDREDLYSYSQKVKNLSQKRRWRILMSSVDKSRGCFNSQLTGHMQINQRRRNSKKISLVQLYAQGQKMEVYTDLLGGYRQRKTTQLSSFKNSYSARRSSMLPPTKLPNSQYPKRKKQVSPSQQQSQKDVQIQLEDVNQQTLFHQHMIELKQKQLLQVKNKMQEALKVQKQVGKLVSEQQGNIDEIEENVDSARSNVQEAGELIQQGAENHKAANKKKMCIMGILFIILLIIVIPIMIKFL